MSLQRQAASLPQDTIAEWFGGAGFLGMDTVPEMGGAPPADYGSFSSRLLVDQNVEALPLPDNDNTWVFAVLFLALAVIAWIRAFHGKGFGLLMNTFITNRPLAQTMSDDHLLMRRVSVFLYLVFAISASLFIYQAIGYFGGNPSWLLRRSGPDGFTGFICIAAAVSLAYILKWLLLKLTGFVFQVETETSEYIFNTYLIVKLLGLALFPVTVCLAFLSLPLDGVFVYAGISVAALSYLYRFIRGAAVGRTTIRFSAVHLFLYLCTLEFLPLVVLLKVLISTD